MALIILIENLLTALDNGNCAVGIFLDFQKAFDTVNHNMSGFVVTCITVSSRQFSMGMNRNTNCWNVVFLRVPFLDPCFSLYI